MSIFSERYSVCAINSAFSHSVFCPFHLSVPNVARNSKTFIITLSTLSEAPSKFHCNSWKKKRGTIHNIGYILFLSQNSMSNAFHKISFSPNRQPMTKAVPPQELQNTGEKDINVAKIENLEGRSNIFKESDDSQFRDFVETVVITWSRKLKHYWTHYNNLYLKDRLVPPLIVIQQSSSSIDELYHIFSPHGMIGKRKSSLSTSKYGFFKKGRDTATREVKTERKESSRCNENDQYVFSSSQKKKTAILGSWNMHERTISISLSHILNDPWESVLDTLRHEMAHQYVDEVLHKSPEGFIETEHNKDVGGKATYENVEAYRPHGPMFKEACRLLRCEAAAMKRSTKSGNQEKNPRHECESRSERAHEVEADTSEEQKVMQRIKKIMALSGSNNQHEAELALTKAQQLLRDYNIDIIRLDRERYYSHLDLGNIKKRRTSFELKLSGILQEFFFVECIWVHSYDPLRDYEGLMLRIYGTKANLEMAEYVYEYVIRIARDLWAGEAKRDDSKQAADKEVRIQKPRNKGDSSRFYYGLISGLYTKLKDLKYNRDQSERGSQRVSSSSSQKKSSAQASSHIISIDEGDSKLANHVKHHHPSIVTRKTRYNGDLNRSKIFQRGVEQGKIITIHKPLHSNGQENNPYLEQRNQRYIKAALE